MSEENLSTSNLTSLPSRDVFKDYDIVDVVK